MRVERIPRLAALGLTIWLVAGSHASEIEITFTSSYDQSEQKALAFVPAIDGEEKRPLLVIAHFYSGHRRTAKGQGYHRECEKRGWFCVCPDLHGHRADGRASFAAIEAQHDIIDVIETMRARYQVDASRIYLAGRSMGGMLAQIMAAKYPEVFAAVVAGQGISDLRKWLSECPHLGRLLEPELDPPYDKNAFEYARRSPIHFARNFQYVPLILWHGTNDTVVRPEQTERLFEEIRKYHRFQPDVHWLIGASHNPINYPPAWVCDQLQYYRNISDGGKKAGPRSYPRLSLVTDEDKDFFWLGVCPRGKETFAEVDAELRDGILHATTKRTAAIRLNLDALPRRMQIGRYSIRSDRKLILHVLKAGKEIRHIEIGMHGEGAVQ